MQRHETIRGGCLAAMAVSVGALLLASCTNRNYRIADTNDDGQVGPAEFKRYMLEAIYAEADANRDKKITFEEWKAANPDAQKAKFRQPDTDGDGAITPAEAKEHFDNNGTMEDLFSQVDADGDGFVSIEEIRAFQDKMAAEAGTEMQKLSRAASKSKHEK